VILAAIRDDETAEPATEPEQVAAA
jgi:hypothetical protein